ncbi:hypothetical protein [Flavobacterium hercynium]|uniref:Uncharacterized protein n=1 Tax=Flavobacterium hercynium TaxID=387094 RepID=A0A226HKF8_9FLAO|nr:hypothetical protein [Flavobacterium hercynium]OXA94733.1 hypothetical protein B0A66_03120 [Flavobacterium hercynium]SMP07636.1 hypothetical protein SAMN06265346_10255 [Flavobacterium hercynium]
MLLWFCLTSLFHNSNSQTKIVPEEGKNQLIENKMEYFALEKYKDWEIDTKWLSREDKKFLKKQYERAIIWYLKEKIQVTRSSTLNPYTSIFVYNEKTSMLLTYVLQFYQFPIGTAKHYDENGILIKEIDYDKPYPFSLKELIEKIKEEYNIDLEDKEQQAVVSRQIQEDLQKPIYEVYLLNDEFNSKPNYILIDGQTGAVLFESNVNSRDEKAIPPLYQYLSKLKNKETEDNSYYKSYKGKNYTKKEWEAFQDEWHKNYEEQKNGRNFFFDNIFKK